MSVVAGVRQPSVAGQFYDADPKTLRHSIDAFIRKADAEPGKNKGRVARALVVPHAGYMFSGAAAVKTLLRAKNQEYDRIIIIAPSHHLGFHGLAMGSYSKMRTPLWETDVDIAAAQTIAAAGDGKWLVVNDKAHDKEHSLEVQIPLLQCIFPETPVLPLVCGHIDVKTCHSFANAMAGFWNPRTLWVASSDFTHYGAAFGYIPFASDIPEKLRRLDLGAVNEILKLDPDGFAKYVEDSGATICGAAPIRLMLQTARDAVDAGAKLDAELVEYTSSGELTGDYSHCVSYAGVAILDK